MQESFFSGGDCFYECYDFLRSVMKAYNKYRANLFWLITSLILMLLCAGFTSPLYPHYTGRDSSTFLVLARGILDGRIPYIDLFDHKGPVFYWMEAIGYFFGGRTGVFFLECILLLCDLYFINRISSLLYANCTIAAIAFFSTFFYLFQHGNLTEEFCMPLILAGLFFELKFLLSREKKHPPGIAYIYGLLLGLIALIRLNNAVSICAMLLCIIVILIHDRQRTNLLANILAGILGLATVTVPVCFYFYRQGALYDMLYGTFLLNLLYAKYITHYPILSSAFLYFMKLLVPGVYAFAVFWEKWRAERSRAYAALLFSTALTYGMLVYTNAYMHYFMLGIPLLTIAAAAQSPKAPSGTPMNIRMIVRRRQDTQDRWKNVLSIFLGGITAGYILLSAYSACAPIYKTYLTDIAYDEYQQTQTGMAVIPENERGAVIAFDTVSDFYCHAGILPCYRYFTLQKWLSTEKVNVYQEFMLYLIKERPLWVVIRTGDNDKILNEILTLLYSCRYSDDKYSYYRYTDPVITPQTADISAQTASS